MTFQKPEAVLVKQMNSSNPGKPPVKKLKTLRGEGTKTLRV